MTKHHATRRGDTLVEVMFSVGIFGLVAIGAIGVMNRGLYTAQGTLETTMARGEMDTQAEALRFIHDAYASKKTSTNNNYREVWKTIVKDYVNKPDNPAFLKFKDIYQLIAQGGGEYNGEFYSTCGDLYSEDVLPSNAFAINPSEIQSGDIDSIIYGTDKLSTTGVYPRLNYLSESDLLTDATASGLGERTLQTAEGIVVLAAESESGILCDPTEDDPSVDDWRPDFYDFYIYTCWDTPGSNNPRTVSTTVRLYNSDQINMIMGHGVSFSGVDVAVIIDVSGSMAGAISAAKVEASDTAKVVLDRGGRVALMTYSDISKEHEEMIMYCDFETCTPDSFASSIDSLRMMNGGDTPESVLAAIDYALTHLSWRSGGAIVLMTDADYHDPEFGHTTTSIVNRLNGMGIKYYSVESFPQPIYDRLTNDTGGKRYTHGVASAFAEILQELPTPTASDCRAVTVASPEPPADPPTREFYQIFFDANGGDGTMTPMTGVVGGESISLTANAFTRDGYIFDGWEDDSHRTFADQEVVNDTSFTLVDGKVTLHAKWKSIMRTITYYGHGDTDSEGNVLNTSKTDTVAVGSTYTILPSSSFYRKSYDLVKWTTNEDGTGTQYAPGMSITITNNLTLYAQWKSTDFTGAGSSIEVYDDDRMLNVTLLTPAFATNVLPAYTLAPTVNGIEKIYSSYSGGFYYACENPPCSANDWTTNGYILKHDKSGGTGVFYVDINEPNRIDNTTKSKYVFYYSNAYDRISASTVTMTSADIGLGYPQLSFWRSGENYFKISDHQKTHKISGADATIDDALPTRWIIGRFYWTKDTGFQMVNIYNKFTNASPSSFL